MGIIGYTRFIAATVLAGSFLLSAQAGATDLLIPAPTLVPAPAVLASKNPWIGISTGFGVGPSSYYGYGSFTLPMNGDLYADGFLLRGELSGSHFKSSTSQDDSWAGAGLIGYQTKIGIAGIKLFVGPEFQTHNNPDPTAEIRGDSFGVKGEEEFYLPLNQSLYLDSFGSYSTNFHSYYISGRLMQKVTDVLTIGPQVSALGGDGYAQVRLGGSASVATSFGNVGFGVGYIWTTLGDKNDGVYAGINLDFRPVR